MPGNRATSELGNPQPAAEYILFSVYFHVNFCYVLMDGKGIGEGILAQQDAPLWTLD